MGQNNLRERTYFMRIQTKLPFVVISACLLVSAAVSSRAVVIGTSFVGRGGGPGAIMLPTDTAGVFAQTNWNNIDSGDPVVDGISLAQIDGDGNFTSVKVIYDGSDSWNSDGPTVTGDDKMMKGIIKANPDPDLAPANNSDRILLVVTNLTPSALYTVLVYSLENGTGAKMSVNVGSTTYYIAQDNNFALAGGTFIPATSTTLNDYQGANYAGFTNVAAAGNGTITITALKFIEDNGMGGQINDGIGIPGIQIMSAAPFAVNTDPCSITADPQPQTVVVGKLANFSVGTQGPCKIQWTKNNVPIPGAINPTLSFVTTSGDNNAQIRAIVYNNVITNTSQPALLQAVNPVLTQGFLAVDRWENIGDATGPAGIEDLKNAIAGGPPTFSFYVAGPDVPQSNPNIANFGGRLIGWFQPDVTGYYDFFIRSDDPSQLFLNSVNPGTGTNTLPDITTEFPICQEDTCCNAFQEPGVSSRTTSTPIFLEAGKLYGSVILYKEGGGGDFVQVAWRRTNDSAIAAATLRPISSANCWTLATGIGQAASISSQPQSLTVFEGRPASFEVGVTTTPTAGLFGVQWSLVSVGNIIGATSTRYTIPSAALSDNNKQFFARAFTLTGPLTSSVVTLTVLPDTNPPVPLVATIVRTNVSGSAIQVGVGFDEAVNKADLIPGNFTLIGGSGTLSFPTNSYDDYKGVLFDANTLIPGNSYTVRVANIRDAKGNAISSSGIDVPFTVRTKVGWADTGSPSRPGQVVPVGDKGFDILNGGRQEWSTYDEATIAYLVKTNDFDVKVQVIYAEPGSQWTRVGLMARNNLDVGEPATDRSAGPASTASAYAQTHVNPNQTLASSSRFDPTGATPVNPTPNNGHEQNQRRGSGANATTPDASTGWGNPSGIPVYPDEWLRLQRTGNTLHGYRSKDGITWIDQGTTSLLPSDQQAVMHVGPFAAVETGNIWAAADHDVYGVFDPKYDRLFVYQFRNFGDTFGPSLSIVGAAGNVTITYTGVLYSAPSLAGPWTVVSGATSPYTTAASGTARYFRAGEQ